MEIASSGLATYGNEFSEILGLVTAGTEILQGRSSQVARGLSTIASRIVKNQDALAKYNITVQNADGSLKSTYDVLTELAPQWEKMTDAQRVALGDSIAGTNQYKVLAAVMSNINTAVNANETALSSEGSALNENSKYMESFEARLSNLDSKWQAFSNDIVNNDFAKFIVDSLSVVLSALDTGVGQILTQITLLTSVGWGATSLLKAMKIVSAATKQFKILSVAIGMAKVTSDAGIGAMTGFKAAITAAGGAASVALPIIAALSAALVVFGTVIPAIVKEIEKAKHAASYEGKVEAFENSIKKADEMSQKFQGVNRRLTELNGVRWEDRSQEMQDEIDHLKLLLEIYKNLSEAAQQEKLNAARDLLSTAENKGVAFGSKVVSTGNYDYSGTAMAEVLKKSYKNAKLAIVDAMDALYQMHNITYEDYVDLMTAYESAADGSEEQEDALNALEVALRNYGLEVSDVKLKTSDFYTEFNKLRKGIKESGEPGLSFDSQRFYELRDAYLEQYKAGNLLIEQGDTLSADTQKTRREFENMAAVDYILTHSMEGLLQQTRGLAEAYGMSEEKAGMLIRTNQRVAESFSKTSNAIKNYSLINAQIGLAKYVDMVDKAINAKARFDSAISAGGNNSSGYEGFADVYSEMQKYLDQDQIGGEFAIGAQLLFDPTTYREFADALENDLPRALQIAQEQMGKLAPLFGDAENAGLGVLHALYGLADGSENAAVKISDVDGQTEISIENMSALAQALGISESALFSSVQAWKDYGINAKITSDELVGYLGDIGVATDNNVIDMDQVVEKMREIGATDEDIWNLQNMLQSMSDVTLQNPVASMDDLKDESGNADDAANELYNTIQNINNTTFSGMRTRLSLLGQSFDAVARQANNAADAADRLSGDDGNNDRRGNGGREPEGAAKGTHNAKGGLTLVNEEGPEIIEEGGRRRIAGDGSPTYTNLKKGATVYTAKETKNMAMRKAGISATVSTSSSYLNTLFSNYGLSSSSYSSSSSGASSGYSASHTSSGYSGSSSDSTEDAWKNEFDEWLKWKDHQLAMDQITEQQYYDELNRMNEKYFANRTEYLDEYWQYQEKIYQWQKEKEKDLLNRQLDDLKELEDAINEKYDAQIKALEDENDELNDQLHYEELLANLAKAQSSRTLVYKDGRFQYVADEQKVAEAQAQLDEYNRQKELEAQKEEIEKLRENELAAIIEQEKAINEKLDALSDNKGYASGSLGVHGGLSLVGENGPELRVLNRGDGIIPNTTTRNLMEWGAVNKAAFKSSIIDELRQFGGNVVQEFGNITLPNVTDVISFINEIKQLKRYAYQR